MNHKRNTIIHSFSLFRFLLHFITVNHFYNKIILNDYGLTTRVNFVLFVSWIEWKKNPSSFVNLFSFFSLPPLFWCNSFSLSFSFFLSLIIPVFLSWFPLISFFLCFSLSFFFVYDWQTSCTYTVFNLHPWVKSVIEGMAEVTKSKTNLESQKSSGMKKKTARTNVERGNNIYNHWTKIYYFEYSSLSLSLSHTHTRTLTYTYHSFLLNLTHGLSKRGKLWSDSVALNLHWCMPNWGHFHQVLRSAFTYVSCTRSFLC